MSQRNVTNKISKRSKGKYYKPEKPVFGSVYPEPEQVVKDLLIEDGKLMIILSAKKHYFLTT